MVTAVAQDKDRALHGLQDLADNANEQQEWRLKGRLAVVALHLSDPSIATDINKPDRDDPTQQTVFIHDVFPTWHGDLGRLATVMDQADDAGLRHGICLAMGKLSDLADAQQQWHEMMSTWYRQQPDSGTHSAAR